MSCSNCFFGANVDVFFDVSIKDFTMQQFSAGMRNIHIDGGFVVDFNAKAPWSTGVDKTLPIFKSTNVLDFWIGPGSPTGVTNSALPHFL